MKKKRIIRHLGEIALRPGGQVHPRSDTSWPITGSGSQFPDFETDRAQVHAEMRDAFSQPSFLPKPLPERSPGARERIMASRAEMIARGVELPDLRSRHIVRARAYGGEMTTPNKRTVTPHPDGWSVDKPGTSRASSVHDTQKQAIDAARQTLKNAGGGELAIKGKDGAVRNQDTVAPGNDPRKSKG